MRCTKAEHEFLQGLLWRYPSPSVTEPSFWHEHRPPCVKMFLGYVQLGEVMWLQRPLDLSRSFKGESSSVQSLNHVWLFGTPWTAAHQASLSITNSLSLLKLMYIELVMPCNHFILSHALLHMPSIFPSCRVFSNESVLRIRWPKYWSFSFSISPSNDFRTDFLCDGLIGSPCSPRDSQESSPTTHFKSINFWGLSFLYGPTVMSIHDYWKDHSLD